MASAHSKHHYGSDPGRRAPSTTIETQYEPETARYGGSHGLAVAHRVFTADSTAVCLLLATPQQPSLTHLTSAHDLLTGLTGHGDQRAEVYRRQAGWVLDQLCRSHDERSRVWREAEDQLDRLGSGLIAANAWLAEQPGYQRQLRELAVLGEELASAARDGVLSRSLQAILVDLQHMHCNRVGLSLRKEMSAVLLLAKATEHGLLS